MSRCSKITNHIDELLTLNAADGIIGSCVIDGTHNAVFHGKSFGCQLPRFDSEVFVWLSANRRCT